MLVAVLTGQRVLSLQQLKCSVRHKYATFGAWDLGREEPRKCWRLDWIGLDLFNDDTHTYVVLAVLQKSCIFIWLSCRYVNHIYLVVYSCLGQSCFGQ